MNRLIDYIIAKEKEGIELILKIVYTQRRGWQVTVHKKGYDMPIVYIKENNKEEAFNIAYKLLNAKLGDK